MHSLLELTSEELRAWLVERGLPAYRAGQLHRWIFRRRAWDFAGMTDLPQPLRQKLACHFRIRTSHVATRRKSKDGTEKLLVELADRHRIECVLLRDDKNHRTACVSTQVGCAIGCVFCASGVGGMARSLTTGEILEQMLHLQRRLPSGERLSHIVVMGMGEPLANLEALLPALQVATGCDGFGISARRVTISTVGLPAAIRRLARQPRPYHLAVSLHAPDDPLRGRIVPAARRVRLASILAAADDYFAMTGRRVTFEYVLLDGINDRPEHARRLVDRLEGRPALMNLIPCNPVGGLPYRPPPAAAVARFADILRRGKLNVKIRYRKGDRIDAACGQLRRSSAGPVAGTLGSGPQPG